jgi:hypothetical protein
VRLSATLLVLSMLGIIGGAWLIGLAAVGGAVIFDSLCVGAWALIRDDGTESAPAVHGTPTLADILDRARKAS